MPGRHRLSRRVRLLSVFAAALILLSASVLLIPARSVAVAQGANLLQNPGFEGTYSAFNGDPKRLVAPGWTPWNVPPPGSPSYANNVPEYRVSFDRIHGGAAAQEFFTFYATHTGGVYQQVRVATGAKVKFTAWLRVWSTLYDDPERSEIPGGVKVQVGVDPSGGTDGTSETAITWSDAQEFYDQYKELTLETTAKADMITVFVRSTVGQPVKHNNGFVDDAALIITDGPTPPPPSATPAEPTSTPLPPSATPVPPSATTPPIAGPTGTNTPPMAATITPPGRPSPTREGTIPPTGSGPTATPLTNPTATATSIPPTAGPSNTPRPSASATPIVTSTPISGEFPFTVRYTVQAGDTVSGLAQRFNSSIEVIVAANGITNVGLIFVGQILDIPTRTPPNAPTVTPVPPRPTATAIILPTVVVRTATPGAGGGGSGSGGGLNGPTNNGIGTYIVQPGDDLATIASYYKTTAYALARLNGILNPNLVYPGQVLVVPGPGNNTGGKPPIPQPVRTHTVQTGENMYRISLRYGVTIDAILRANGLFNPNLVYVGQVLRIP